MWHLLTAHARPCVRWAGTGTKFGLVFYGLWVWLLKDWIDMSFMNLFKPDLLPTVGAGVHTAMHPAAAVARSAHKVVD